MTLVNITLTELEQEFLLSVAGVYANSIAEKIRRAQEGGLFEIYPPTALDGHNRMNAIVMLNNQRTSDADTPQE